MVQDSYTALARKWQDLQEKNWTVYVKIRARFLDVLYAKSGKTVYSMHMNSVFSSAVLFWEANDSLKGSITGAVSQALDCTASVAV